MHTEQHRWRRLRRRWWLLWRRSHFNESHTSAYWKLSFLNTIERYLPLSFSFSLSAWHFKTSIEQWFVVACFLFFVYFRWVNWTHIHICMHGSTSTVVSSILMESLPEHLSFERDIIKINSDARLCVLYYVHCIACIVYFLFNIVSDTSLPLSLSRNFHIYTIHLHLYCLISIKLKCINIFEVDMNLSFYGIEGQLRHWLKKNEKSTEINQNESLHTYASQSCCCRCRWR